MYKGLEVKLILFLSLTFAISLVPGCDSATYQGKDVSHWVKMSEDADVETQREALEALDALYYDSDRAKSRIDEYSHAHLERCRRDLDDYATSNDPTDFMVACMNYQDAARYKTYLRDKNIEQRLRAHALENQENASYYTDYLINAYKVDSFSDEELRQIGR